MAQAPDIKVENHGSIVLFIPQTGAGEEWIDDNLAGPEVQTFGGGIVVEPRYAGAILQGIDDAGLTLDYTNM